MVQFMEVGQCYLVKTRFREAILKVTSVSGHRGRYDVSFVDVVSGMTYTVNDVRSTSSAGIEFDANNEEDFVRLDEYNRIL